MRLANFSIHLSKALRLPRKSDAKSYKVLHLSRKIIFASLTIWCSKMQPLSGNKRPDLLTSLMNMFIVCTCHGKCIFLDLLQMSHGCQRFEIATKPSRFAFFLHLPHKTTVQHPKMVRHVVFLPFWFRNVIRATMAYTFLTSQLPKVLRTRLFLTLLTSKCASRYNGVHFFHITAAKSAPDVRCF